MTPTPPAGRWPTTTPPCGPPPSGRWSAARGLDDGALAGALADVDPTVRRRAAELAARHPDVSLLDALADADDRVVEMAAFACGEREQAGPDGRRPG